MKEESIESIKIASLVRTNKFSVYAYYLLIVCKGWTVCFILFMKMFLTTVLCFVYIVPLSKIGNYSEIDRL